MVPWPSQLRHPAVNEEIGGANPSGTAISIFRFVLTAIQTSYLEKQNST